MRLVLSAIVSLLFVACHADVEELTHFHGQSEAAVIASLGSPSYTNVKILHYGASLPELYVEIHNTYAPSDPKIEGVEIKELRWNRAGFTEAVFMHKVNGTWTVLESCRWKDGIAF